VNIAVRRDVNALNEIKL